MGSVIRISAAIALILGLNACGSGGNNGKGFVHFTEDEGMSNVSVVDSQSPYAKVLKGCALAESYDASCKMSVLPPLGVQAAKPTKADIMSRVLTSHAWMAKRFSEVLDELPPEMYSLFGSITAIVIDDDIRPSYYWALTGAIYLDPGYIFLTEEERLTINQKEDPRQAYARQMSYGAWSDYYDPLHRQWTRSLEFISMDLAKLLFHELAHANDFLSQTHFNQLDLNQKIVDAIETLKADSPSRRLGAQYPLKSEQMRRLGQVLYKGSPPTTQEKAMTATEVGKFFAEDVANDDYAYSDGYEDLAMLFEDFMMRVHYGFDRDVAFVSMPEPNGNPDYSPGCEEFIVGWGMRNRLGLPGVKERAQFVVQQILPASDYASFFDSLPSPQLMPTGKGWCETRDAMNRVTPASLNAGPQKSQKYVPAPTFVLPGIVKPLPQ